MGPFPKRKVGKENFVLVVVDRLMGMSGAWAFGGEGSKEVIAVLKEWVRIWGTHQVLFANVAQVIQSQEFQKYFRLGDSSGVVSSLS